MGFIRNAALPAALFVVLIEFFAAAAGASTFISDSVFGSSGSSSRRLLQTVTNCPVSFEFKNYTIITSQCKGPKYPPTPCCNALKEFACPYADQLNDGTNDCASIMFSYINLYGKYPPGLFASECREGKQGLACPADAPQSENDASAGHINQSIISLVALVCGVVLAFLWC